MADEFAVLRGSGGSFAGHAIQGGLTIIALLSLFSLGLALGVCDFHCGGSSDRWGRGGSTISVTLPLACMCAGAWDNVHSSGAAWWEPPKRQGGVRIARESLRGPFIGWESRRQALGLSFPRAGCCRRFGV